MEFTELEKDYSAQASSINELSEEKYNAICKCLDFNKMPIFIKPLEDSDFEVGKKIYVGENNPKNIMEKMTWHVYKITYIRSGAVFYTRDNGRKEYYFDMDCLARRWMFPMKINIGNNSMKRINIECKCPLVTTVVK